MEVNFFKYNTYQNKKNLVLKRGSLKKNIFLECVSYTKQKFVCSRFIIDFRFA